MKIAIVTCLAVALAWDCNRHKQEAAETVAGAAGVESDTATSAAPSADDPCRYLAASEVEPYTGPLVAPPFRANSGDAAPNRSADACLYRGKDGRGVFVQYSAAGGRVGGTVGRRVPQVMDRTLSTHDGSESQGPAAAVMGPVGPGPWDNSNWFPTGALMVFKGDASFDIDMGATNGGKDGAIDLATKAIARLPQPLDYDGTRAVAFAPKPVPKVPACDLIPRARAEVVLGTLSRAPVADTGGTVCTYTVASSDGDVNYPVAITWGNGYKALNSLKHGLSNIMGPMVAGQKTFGTGRAGVGQLPAGGMPAMPAMPALDPAQQEIFKNFSKMVGVPGMAGVAKRGMQTDSTLVGPWDSAALVNGTWLIASRHDVAVFINVGDADYDKAKALLVAACEQL